MILPKERGAYAELALPAEQYAAYLALLAGPLPMKIRPRCSFDGSFAIPGDKSITHRAIMFNGIAEGEAHITNALLGEDCLSTAACMRALGADVIVGEGEVCVRGTSRPHGRRPVTAATAAQLCAC